jgi:hypothetical protein
MEDLLEMDSMEEGILKKAYDLPKQTVDADECTHNESGNINQVIVKSSMRASNGEKTISEYLRKSAGQAVSPGPHNSDRSIHSSRKLQNSSGLISRDGSDEIFGPNANYQQHKRKLELIRSLHVRHQTCCSSALGQAGQHLIPAHMPGRPYSTGFLPGDDSRRSEPIRAARPATASPAAPAAATDDAAAPPRAARSLSRPATAASSARGPCPADPLAAEGAAGRRASRSCAAANAEAARRGDCAFLLQSGMCLLHGRSALNRAFLERVASSAFVRQRAAQAAALRREQAYRNGAEIGTRARRLRLRLAAPPVAPQPPGSGEPGRGTPEGAAGRFRGRRAGGWAR